MLVFDSTTAKSSTRPPIAAGPISRNLRFFSMSDLGGFWAATRAGKSRASERSDLMDCPESYYCNIPRKVTPGGARHKALVQLQSEIFAGRRFRQVWRSCTGLR